MTSNKKLSVLEKQILANLKSKDEKVIIKSINDIRESGETYVIKPLMELYFNTSSQNITKETLNLFRDIKDSKYNLIISNTLEDYIRSSKMTDFISALWQSSIKFEDISVFIKIFIQCEDTASLEALTLMQQSADTIKPEIREKCLKILKSELTKLTPFKKQLAVDLLDILR